MMASVDHRTPAETNGGSAAHTISVENPATGELITTIPVLGADELHAMAARARTAQPGWDALGFEARGRVLRRAQKWMIDNADRVIEVVVAETGKTYEDAQVADFGYTVSALGFWAKEAQKYLADERVPSWNNPLSLGKKLIIRYAPVGVVGVIGPWNFPITNSFGDCIPALAAGNSVILKPSEVTPLSSLLMAEMLEQCGLPENVFQVATGDGSTGAALIGEVDCVMFTGSSRTGKAVMKAAAERCYVEEPVYDRFVEKVTDNVRRLRQGAPTGVGTVEVGAVIFPPQLDIVVDHVEDALAKGARVLTGGHPRPGPGRFYEPTVLVDVDHSMKIMREETFGPTLPIMRIADAEEGIKLANDSDYGLQASVWTRDVKRGESLARRIEAGVVCVNDAQVNYTALNLPMGGWKSSGLGTRHGAAGIRKYTKVQSLLITHRALKREPFMFPYKPRSTMMLRRVFKLLYGRGSRD
jgi:acyl-CoA reductase-like NAD-dependent aldehyde dehydrogenase